MIDLQSNDYCSVIVPAKVVRSMQVIALSSQAARWSPVTSPTRLEMSLSASLFISPSFIGFMSIQDESISSQIDRVFMIIHQFNSIFI